MPRPTKINNVVIDWELVEQVFIIADQATKDLPEPRGTGAFACATFVAFATHAKKHQFLDSLAKFYQAHSMAALNYKKAEKSQESG